MFEMSSRLHPTLQVVNRLDSFVDANGGAVVIGDAAHSAPVRRTFNRPVMFLSTMTIRSMGPTMRMYGLLFACGFELSCA